MILELGANDMLRAADPAVTEKALDGIVTRLKARGIPVLLAGMKAGRNLGPDYVARFDAIYPALAQRHASCSTRSSSTGSRASAGLALPDGLHPTRAGVERIVQGILPTVEDFLKRLRQGS